jgi:MFS family permease
LSLRDLYQEGGPKGCLVILASAFGVGVGLLGLPILTIGLFMAPLGHEFGWSRAAIAGASTCINAATIVAAPFVGRLCDAIGVRRVAFISLSSLTIGFALLSRMDGSLIYYYLVWILMAAFGVGTSGIVWTRAIGSYFERNRGRALGLALTGTAFAALLSPLALGPLIADMGWRAGYLALCAVCAAVLPLAYFCFSEKQAAPVWNISEVAGVTFPQAARMGAFWRLGLAIFFLVLGMGSLLVHFVPLAIDRGLPPGYAAQMFAVIGLSMLFGRIFIGMALDRFDPLWVAALSCALPAASCVFLLYDPLSVYASTIVAATLIGFSAGAEVDMLAFLVARIFGLRAYGAIYGCQLSFFAAGSGFGGILTGLIHDRTGSYNLALGLGVVIFLVGAAILLTLGQWLSSRAATDTPQVTLAS